MKFVFLAIAVLAVWPIALLLRAQPRFRPVFWTFVGLIPFIATFFRLQVAFVSWGDFWRGHAFAVEVALFDLLMISAYLSLQFRPATFSHVPFVIYVLAVFQSILHAEFATASMFFFTQTLRIYLAVFVISKCAIDISVSMALLRGLGLGIVIQAVMVTWQRVVLHTVQPSGTFGHQNILGMSAHFVVYPHFALAIMARRGLIHLLAPLAGAWIVANSASRGAVGFFGMGVTATYLLTALGRWTMRKTVVTAAGILGALILAPVVINAFMRRLSVNPMQEDVYDERGAFNRAALAILDQFPFGVGANHYVYVAKTYGYALRAGVVPVEANLGTVVHNAYLLMAAETGYIGLVSFLVMLLYPLTVALVVGLMNRNTTDGALLLGVGISLLAVYMHSYFEWILFNSEIQYLLAITFGLAFGNAYRLRHLRNNPGAAPLTLYEAPAPQRRAGSLLR